jgi:putative transcriptional regulator
MTQAAVEHAALSDPDACPLTRADTKRMKRTPQAKIIRRALRMTQEAFAGVIAFPSARCAIGNQGAPFPISRPAHT